MTVKPGLVSTSEQVAWEHDSKHFSSCVPGQVGPGCLPGPICTTSTNTPNKQNQLSVTIYCSHILNNHSF